MKVRSIHKVSSSAMALLVLISTLSISIEKHYCGEHLVDVAIFSDAEKCGMESSEEGVEMSESCCKDVVDLVEGQDELSLEKTELMSSSEKIFILSFSSVFGRLDLPELKDDPPFQHYNPPEVVQDIQILNAVFLI